MNTWHFIQPVETWMTFPQQIRTLILDQNSQPKSRKEPLPGTWIISWCQREGTWEGNQRPPGTSKARVSSHSQKTQNPATQTCNYTQADSGIWRTAGEFHANQSRTRSRMCESGQWVDSTGTMQACSSTEPADKHQEAKRPCGSAFSGFLRLVEKDTLDWCIWSWSFLSRISAKLPKCQSK